VEAREPVDENTIFHVMSMSKASTGVALDIPGRRRPSRVGNTRSTDLARYQSFRFQDFRKNEHG
jgi:hypothetical protein